MSSNILTSLITISTLMSVQSKVCPKKIAHLFCSISQKISVLEENYKVGGQNNLFQRLK